MRNLGVVLVSVLLAPAAFAQQPKWPYSMDYGPCLMTTFTGGGACGTVAKGLVVRLGDRAAIAFDTELLRMAAAWTGGWLKLRGTAYDGAHGPFPERDGTTLVESRVGPGWARAGSFDDPRSIPHGPLPRAWGQYLGHSRVGDDVVIAYRIGDMTVRESYAVAGGDTPVVLRTLELGPCRTAQRMVVLDGPDGAEAGTAAPSGARRLALLRCKSAAEEGASQDAAVHNLIAALSGSAGPELEVDGARVTMTVPAHAASLRVRLHLTRVGEQDLTTMLATLSHPESVAPLATGPGAKRWGDAVVTKGVIGPDDGPFAVDTISIPFDNPYGSRMRTAAFDFFSDGRAAVSTWNGDVWIVSGIDGDLGELRWQRFATGLFDPLGLRIVDDVVYTHGRDGLTRLIDSDGDGEADRYECFNNQVMVTPAFHEFAFDLQTDRDGNFYFSKGAPVNPGGRGFMPIAPHHGCILKVSKDGSSITRIATGLRAPNGVGVSPDGIITSGDNEGTYMPRCRINWIERPGFYGGVKDTAHRTPVPDRPDLPLCWMPMEVDNSSGGQVWVTSDKWPELQGRLLHNSYGKCSTYLVLTERVNGQIQGGVVRLPINYTSSAMRSRFSPIDGQLYTIGLKGWQTSAAREGGFHRVRRTGRPLDLPLALRTCDQGVYLTFSTPLDPETATDPESFGIEIWNYLYSQNYGSPEISVLHPERKVAQGKPNRDPLTVSEANLSGDGRTVFLRIAGMRPVHQMKITWDIDSKDGRALRGQLHNTIHALAADPGFPQD
ncbi:MAG TPA: hypothetical protein ENI87_14005 [bacterium]|nr:hypothetical protein [bacterium]